jgi:hypothetical protein
MKFISVKGHFQSDCLDAERAFIINTNEITAIYQTIARYVINLKTPIQDMDSDHKTSKVYVVGEIDDIYPIFEILEGVKKEA